MYCCCCYCCCRRDLAAERSKSASLRSELDAAGATILKIKSEYKAVKAARSSSSGGGSSGSRRGGGGGRAAAAAAGGGSPTKAASLSAAAAAGLAPGLAAGSPGPVIRGQQQQQQHGSPDTPTAAVARGGDANAAAVFAVLKDNPGWAPMLSRWVESLLFACGLQHLLTLSYCN
jgi:hypothetical protein